MMTLLQHQQACRYFAALLSYPQDDVAEQGSAGLRFFKTLDPVLAAGLEVFVDFLRTNDCSRIEEAYTGTFDLQSLCHPYIGYQLCGESQQRTVFMLELVDLYKKHGFASANELPDHLCEVLRFIGSTGDRECRRVIIEDGLLPALEKMTLGVPADGHPYVTLLNALHRFLRESRTEGERPGADRQKECVS